MQTVSKKETDKFLSDKSTNLSSESNKCPSRWWNQGYRHQQVICETIESYYFRALVIFLVVLDTSLVISEIMLDSLKIHYECQPGGHHLSKHQTDVHHSLKNQTDLHHLLKHQTDVHHSLKNQTDVHHSSSHHDDMKKERVEFFMEMAHYSSITILVLFVIELIIKIYAFAKEFWNIHKKKMEYFDAFIVLTSLGIDLYFLRGEEKVFGEQLLLIFSFRLWRFVRIISSVSEGILHGQNKHKQHLNKQYLLAIHRLMDIVVHKTNYLENNKEDLDSLLEHFRMIDNKCQSSLDALDHNHELTSSALVTQFIEELNGLENKSNNSVISAMFIRSSEV